MPSVCDRKRVWTLPRTIGEDEFFPGEGPLPIAFGGGLQSPDGPGVMASA
ncbi:hypothetical protein ACFTY7_12590 [Streptomyces sp. NPDC057062]